MSTKKIWLVSKIICVLLMTIFTIWHFVLSQNEELQVHFLAVGQGDAIFIQYKDFQILVDGGPDNLVLEKLREVMPIGDHTIDWIILSHPDADHLMGLVDILQSYSVNQIFMPDVKKETRLYQAWIEVIEEKEIPVTLVRDSFREQIQTDLLIEFLHPSPKTIDPKFAANNYSIIVQLTFGQIDILLTGDIEEEVEEKFVEVYPKRDIEVLKAAHHGSKSSSTLEFLESTQPEIIVIEVGEGNKFGHPHERVLYRYNQLRATILRTDQEGTISLSTNGRGIWRLIPRLPILHELVGFNKETLYTGDI